MSIVKSIADALSKNAPAILTGVAMIGVVATAVSASRAAPKAKAILEEAGNPPLKEAVRLTWRLYLPAVALGVVTVASIASVNTIHSHRSKVIATAFVAAETAAIEYRDKVVEVLGEGEDRKIRDAISQDRVTKNPPSEQTTVKELVMARGAQVLLLDAMSGRYFYGNLEDIRQAVNSLNSRLLGGGSDWITVNDFYAEIGMDPVIVLGDLGWTPDMPLEFDYTTAKISEDGEPAIVIETVSDPRPYGSWL